ncbi:ABC transporter ATP-binding protein [Acidobacteria bacterium ACD]|nr:MAG: ABC transporter ATP-binding protein [Acidobacteriota bacterium]MCE7959279.1 ABC transporter ATP-binding protein [Acidobacteria bacterium ACB2]MDL1952127.1 ABC transporter ATP-binding protein [Acidobacteria bacterium ACD]
MLELTDVTKVYDGRSRVVAVDGVSLRVADREMVAVTGPSGSGKSTLLNLMGGLDVPTSGSVVVGGTDLSRLGEEERSLFRRTHVAYVFQAYHLMPTLTAAQNAALPLHLAGARRAEVDERVAAALSDVGLSARASHLPDELSGGERQRVAIARALVTGAPLLLADEPTGNLDTARGAEILALLRRLHAERGTTVVMVTHDPQAAAACDRVVRIRDGRVETGDGA